MNESPLEFIRRRAAENAEAIRKDPELQREIDERSERSKAIITEAERLKLAPKKSKPSGAGNTVHFAREDEI